MTTAAGATRGSGVLQFAIDLGCCAGRPACGDGIERRQHVKALALAQAPGAEREIVNRIADDLALRLVQSRRRLTNARHRLVIERERDLDHIDTILPSSACSSRPAVLSASNYFTSTIPRFKRLSAVAVMASSQLRGFHPSIRSALALVAFRAVPSSGTRARVSTLHSATRALQEDAGLSALHCAAGFLEWFETEDSPEPSFAPLVLLPVNMEKRIANGEYIFSITGRDDDEPVNVALREKLKRLERS